MNDNISQRARQASRSSFRDRWVWLMAWRDARHNFSRLFLFAASLIAGIAAVVSLDAINHMLQQDIDRNAKELVGADLVVKGNRPFEEPVEAAFDSLTDTQASQVNMASMVLFPKSGQSRLIRLVAIGGPFPFYGAFVTQPSNAYGELQKGGYALLDETLASQFGVKPGDSLRLGNRGFQVSGQVSELPGGGGLQASFTPAIYISTQDLDDTGLIQYGSRVEYKRYFKTNSEQATEDLVASLEPVIKRFGHRYDTVEEQKRELGNAFMSIYRFFSLLGFVALMLGCIGVASAVHIYAREKRAEVAVLRCVGSSGRQAFNIYFIQIFCVGVLGSLIGVLIGIGVQQLMPVLLAGIVPFAVENAISWRAVGMGMLLGAVVSVLFSVLPLMTVRFISPLTVLRSDIPPVKLFSRDRLAVWVGIALFPIAFAAIQTQSILTGLSFFGGLVAALACLAGVAFVLLWLVRRYFPKRAGFVWRHALANLFRPNNQTRVLMLTIGLGAFIIATLNVVEKSMLGQVEFTGQENQSNTVLFDIQPSQKEGVLQLMKQQQLPIHQVVPIITCRLAEVNGTSVEKLQEDTTGHVNNWAITHEYRVTYRDTLQASEKLVKGTIQHIQAGHDSVWITLSDRVMENLNVDIGDSLVFDVQGFPIKAFVSGEREVEWPKDPPNFLVVFPSGVLEQAPQIYVASTRIEDQQVANKFQRQLVMTFPNVSLIDLRLIMSTLNGIFDKLGLIIRFLALFSIVTGLVVLAGAVINSKYARIKENVLLRTIGARRGQITGITLIEYAYLGLFSALTGVLFSMLGGWLLTTFFFHITFSFDPVEMLFIVAGVTFLTMLIGWWNSRQVISTPPLQVLRKET